jgi:hypothetical protein
VPLDCALGDDELAGERGVRASLGHEPEHLAFAILIDATVVRGVLLPPTMKLLGDWNWYLPKSLSWLPKVGREPGARA